MATTTLGQLPTIGGNLPKSPRHSAFPRPKDLRRGRSVRRESLGTPQDKTPDEDPLRILAPSQKKLTNIESQRVLAVVDDTSRRLESVFVLPFLSETLERFSVSLGAQLVSMLEDYKRLSTEYTQLYIELQGNVMATRSKNSESSLLGRIESKFSSQSTDSVGKHGQLKPLFDAVTDESHESRFHQVRWELRHCIKSILREISRCASLPSILQAGEKERSRTASQLMDCVTDLREVVNEKLLTTRPEEVRREEHLSAVVGRQKDCEEQIRKLEAELKAAQEHMDQEVCQRNAQIARIISDKNTVEKMAQDACRRIDSDAATQLSQSEQIHETAKTELQENIASLKKSLQEKVTSDRENEQDFRKRVFKRETEVDNWIQKYDQEMGEKQDELETLEAEYEEEKQQLKELEEKLGVLTIEYDAVVKEEEEARKAAEEAERKMNQMAQAATLIQRCWRAYRERTKAEREAKKGKKGKKGKGKKGKKKK